MNNARYWDFPYNWWTGSITMMTILLLTGVSACLFILWSLYLLVRFAIAFGVAAKKLRRKWSRDDRSLPLAQ
jgi:hypothetical protein